MSVVRNTRTGMHPLEALAFGASRRANVGDSMSVLWWTECMNTHGVAQTMRGLRAERAIKIVQVIVSEERAHTRLVRRDRCADRQWTRGGLRTVMRHTGGLADKPDFDLKGRQHSCRQEGEHVQVTVNAHAKPRCCATANTSSKLNLHVHVRTCCTCSSIW